MFDSDGNSVGISKAAGYKVRSGEHRGIIPLMLRQRIIKEFAFVQAVKETALSRAALFGATAAGPNLLVLLLQRRVTFQLSSTQSHPFVLTNPIVLSRTRPFQRNPLLIAPLRHVTAAVVLGLMIPVSLGLFPQLGMVRFRIRSCCYVSLVMNSSDTDLVLQIKREAVEEELQATAFEGHLFYHRGL